MKRNKIAFLTTIFPVSKIFLEPFFKSLQNQTYAGFDVIVLNEDLETAKSEAYNLVKNFTEK